MWNRGIEVCKAGWNRWGNYSCGAQWKTDSRDERKGFWREKWGHLCGLMSVAVRNTQGQMEVTGVKMLSNYLEWRGQTGSVQRQGQDMLDVVEVKLNKRLGLLKQLDWRPTGLEDQGGNLRLSWMRIQQKENDSSPPVSRCSCAHERPLPQIVRHWGHIFPLFLRSSFKVNLLVQKIK